MCLCPITIKNPHYDKNFTNSELKALQRKPLSVGDYVVLNSIENFYNRHNTHIQVPCGHCVECQFARQNEFVQRTLMESLGTYQFMFTLTYNNNHIPTLVVESPTAVKEYQYCDFHDITNLFKRIRTKALRHQLVDPMFFDYADYCLAETAISQLRYAVVSERGSYRHRPHFHGIIFVPTHVYSDSQSYSVDPYVIEKILYEKIKENFADNVGTRKNPKYEPLFTHITKIKRGKVNTNYDLHYILPDSTTGTSKVIYYVSKYVIKPDPYMEYMRSNMNGIFAEELGMEELDSIWNRFIRNRIVTSRNYGLGGTHNVIEIHKYLAGCIKTSADSKATRPMFYDQNGKGSNLCSYYVHAATCFSKSRQKPNSPFYFLMDDPDVVDNLYFLDAATRYTFYFNDSTIFLDQTFEEADEPELWSRYLKLQDRIHKITISTDHED